MIKFLVCLIGWVLLPLVMIVVAWEVAKVWIESKMEG